MRVLLTRQPAQAGALEARLSGAVVGGEAVEVAFLPLVDFVLAGGAEADALGRMSMQLIAPGARGVLVVTSPNAVRALRGHDFGGVDEGVRAVATGPGTAHVLVAASPGIRVWTPPEDRSARGILAGMTGPTAAPEVVEGLWPPAAGHAVPIAWLPQSDLARPALADGLRAAGWDVRTAVAYRTVPYPGTPPWRRLLAEGEGSVAASDPVVAEACTAAPDAPVVTPAQLSEVEPGTVVLLTSSSSAEQFAERGLGPAAGERVRLLAIGEPTRATCARLGLPLAGTCATPDAAGVLAALAGLG